MFVYESVCVHRTKQLCKNAKFESVWHCYDFRLSMINLRKWFLKKIFKHQLNKYYVICTLIVFNFYNLINKLRESKVWPGIGTFIVYKMSNWMDVSSVSSMCLFQWRKLL